MKNILLSLVAAFALVGCVENQGHAFEDEDLKAALPPDATNIEIIGNGWCEFEMDGNKFLFRRTWMDRSASDCITQIK